MPAEREQSVTSMTLIESVRQGDEQAWHRMVTLYGGLVYYWCRKSGAEPSESHDLVQQVFQAVHRSIESFRRDEAGHSFRAWLRTIARYKVMDFFRAQKQRPSPTGGTAGQLGLQAIADSFDSVSSDENATPELSGVVGRAAELVRQQFSDHYWKAFWETTVNERKAADVADELGISRNVVYAAKSRVLAMIRETISGLEDLNL